MSDQNALLRDGFPGEIDGIAPEQVMVVRLPFGCTGVVVIDDVSLGPAIGGLRVNSDVTSVEVGRLARAMTLKNAAAGLPHGGAKAGIRTHGPLPSAQRESVIRAFAVAIRTMTDYIPGPDMGTDETAMAWIRDEIGRAVGLPAVLGGIPLDEIGATGHGIGVCAGALAAAGRLDPAGCRVSVQGFGAVGRHAAQALRERGASIVAVADRSATVYDPSGLDVDRLLACKRSGPLAGVDIGKIVESDACLTVDCDLLVPAAQPDVLHEGNAARVRAGVVLPGANIAATPGAEAALAARGVLVVPDFIANAGGVICAAVEYAGGDAAAAFRAIDARIAENTKELLDRMAARGLPPRAAAEEMAWARVEAARGFRRRF
jgi:glutamate dehydrogenase/leucine dehydrogenase